MTQFISKAAVVAEINRVLNSYDPNEITSGRYALVDLRNFLDTLDVKDVDLNKEIESYFKGFGKFPSVGIDDCIDIAKHFFELGLKVQKGE